jgi:hypothetical protein
MVRHSTHGSKTEGSNPSAFVARMTLNALLQGNFRNKLDRKKFFQMHTDRFSLENF